MTVSAAAVIPGIQGRSVTRAKKSKKRELKFFVVTEAWFVKNTFCVFSSESKSAFICNEKRFVGETGVA